MELLSAALLCEQKGTRSRQGHLHTDARTTGSAATLGRDHRSGDGAARAEWWSSRRSLTACNMGLLLGEEEEREEIHRATRVGSGGLSGLPEGSASFG